MFFIDINGAAFLLSILLMLSGALLCLLVQAMFFFTRERAVRRLRAAALPTVLGAVRDCVLLADSKGRIVEANSAFSRSFEGFALELGETTWRDFCRFLGRDTLDDGELAHGGRLYVVCRRDIPDHGAVCLLRDVTAQRQALQNLEVLNGRLLRLQSNMENTAAAIETDRAVRRIADKAARRRQAASSRLLAGLGHAIQTPVQALRGDDRRQTQAAARQLLDIAGDALDVAAMETGSFALAEADFDFGRMLAQVAGAAQALMQSKNKQFKVEIADDAPAYLCADETRLARVLAGLLLWAGQAAPPGGSVVLAVRSLPSGEDACTLVFQLQGSGPAANVPAGCASASRRVARAMGGALSRGVSPGGGLLLGLTVQARPAQAPRVNLQKRDAAKEDMVNHK